MPNDDPSNWIRPDDLECGNACERHPHDVEESILGRRETLEFTVGDSVTTHIAEELTVVPPAPPNEFRNVGDPPASVRGILPTTDDETTFDRTVRPTDTRVMRHDGPIPETRSDD